MKLQVSDSAEADLRHAIYFYEAQQKGLGEIYLRHLTHCIDELGSTAGTHRRFGAYYRSLTPKFHSGIYYLVKDDTATILRVIDLRRNPAWIAQRMDELEES